MAALDADGLTWQMPATIVAANVGFADQYSFAMVSGKPTVVYCDSGDSRIKLITALDADGQNWGSPAVAYEGVGEYLSLIEFSGRPAFAFRDPVADSLKVAIYR